MSALSSTETASSLPARQEVASGAEVHGEQRSGSAGLPAPVEQWATSVSGVQFLHPAGLQAAGVSKFDTPPDPAALRTTGRPRFMPVCLPGCFLFKALSSFRCFSY